MPLADFERVIAINLIGTFNMMRLAAADMQNLSPLADEERGVIISAASVAAFEGQIGQAAYSASKGGVAALTMPAAREFAQFGIRVNAIAPGIFHTPMLMALPEEAKKSLAAAVPFPKLLGPSRSVRVARAPHHREHVYQRRGDPPRRRAADGAALNRSQGPRECSSTAAPSASNGATATRPGLSTTPAISLFSTPAPRRCSNARSE
jgi:NAD(P)-dependent dehydrogenase (short-subunit alcohol dehydrogenase family)